MGGVSRRDWIKTAIAGGGAGMLFSKLAAGAAVCGLTPRQGEGPFYPQSDVNRDTDLTRLGDGKPRAKGQVILLRGMVQDINCKPIPNALVEIWQAAHTGKYNHTEDTSPLELDPNFQYWGRTRSNELGQYEFMTIVPGHYPVGGGRYRPPHIHYKAHAVGFFSLTTQMYFDPRSYDDAALAELVDRLNKLESVDSRLLVRFANTHIEPGAKLGEFNITLRRNAVG